jgi:uncharacterized protein (DUF1697 family)
VTVYVALLHSIILAAGRRVVMEELRAMAVDLGFENVRTLVATGNLVFEGADLPIGEIENMLERSFAGRFGKPVDIIVRQASGWLRLVASNPFADGVGSDVVVRVMRSALDPIAVDRLSDRVNGPERIALVDGDLWIDFGGKPSLSRLLSGLTTKQLGIGTLRNWNTVRRLGRMLGGYPLLLY